MNQNGKRSDGTLTRNPVCGMTVDPVTSEHRHEHGGHSYWFCSSHCLAKFKATPDAFPAGASPSRADTSPGTDHTCPMHPEVVRSRPWDCPICAMALEPVRVSLDESPNPELIDMNHRMRIGLVLSLPVLVLEMGGHLPGLDFHGSRSTRRFQLDPTRAGHARHPVVRTAVLPTGLGVVGNPQPQHVHVDRHGDGHRYRDGERCRHVGEGRPESHRPGAAPQPRDHAQQFARTSSSPSCTTPLACPSLQACCFPFSAYC